MVLVASLVAALFAVVGAAAAAERPIVYVVVVDGLDGDRYDAGDLPFLKSLPGTYYPESRAIMVSETNPNHVAIATGAYGATSGIPGNAFALYAPLANEDSCAATGPVDEARPPTVTSGENANCVQAQTLFAALKRQAGSRFASAFATGKPKLGRILSGRTVDPAKTDADVIFAPCSSSATTEEKRYCSNVPLNPVSGYALDDRTVMNAVLAQMSQGPNGTRPDFALVNLHQVDSAGHAGGAGAVYGTAIGQAQNEIQRLVETLQARKEWDRTVMIVLSDHGMDTTLSKTSLTSAFTDAGVPGTAFTAVQNGSVDMVYLNDRTAPGRFEILKKMREAALAAGASEALYRQPNPADGGDAYTLATVHPGWRADGPRSGDLFVTAAPGAAWSDPSETSNPLPGSHGGPQTRDNFFLVTGGSPAVKDQRVGGTIAPFFDDTLINGQSAENVDVAATVAGLLGLEPPAQSQGRFLTEAFDLGRLPGGGAPEVLPRIRATRPRPGRVRVATTRVGDRVADLTVRDVRTGRVRRIVQKRALRARLVTLPRGRRYDLRVRVRNSATGVWSSLVRTRVTVRSR